MCQHFDASISSRDGNRKPSSGPQPVTSFSEKKHRSGSPPCPAVLRGFGFDSCRMIPSPPMKCRLSELSHFEKQPVSEIFKVTTTFAIMPNSSALGCCLLSLDGMYTCGDKWEKHDWPNHTKKWNYNTDQYQIPRKVSFLYHCIHINGIKVINYKHMGGIWRESTTVTLWG